MTLQFHFHKFLNLIVLLIIGSPPTKTLFNPPNIDFKIEGTPGKQNTFSI